MVTVIGLLYLPIVLQTGFMVWSLRPLTAPSPSVILFLRLVLLSVLTRRQIKLLAPRVLSVVVIPPLQPALHSFAVFLIVTWCSLVQHLTLPTRLMVETIVFSPIRGKALDRCLTRGWQFGSYG